MTGSAKLLTALVVGLLTASTALADDSPLVGQWERKVGKSVVSLAFTDENRLHVNFSGDGEAIGGDSFAFQTLPKDYFDDLVKCKLPEQQRPWWSGFGSSLSY